MLPSDADRFSQLLADVMAYYGKDVSEFTQGLFWNACAGFEFEQVARAFEAHAKDAEHGRFSPKVADLVRELAGTKTDRALLAWGKTLKAMSSVGAYQDVVFDDAAIHAAVEDVGGWPKLCRTTFDDLGYLQHRFCEAHRAYTKRGTFEFPRRLAGARDPDETFVKHGLPPPRPVMVGDIEACRRVYELGGATGKSLITFNVPMLAGAAAEKAIP